MRIGFIGLGVMGVPMVKNLLAAEHDVSVNRIKLETEFLLEQGAVRGESPKEVASNSEVTILMLPNTPEVEEVLFGEKGVAEGMAAGSLIIDMSSIAPVETVKFAQKIMALGGEYLDAPVSGGQSGAETATLTIMAGGPESTFQRALPILKHLGSSITRIGDHGSGQVAKVANQIIVALTIQAVAEAFTLVEEAGVDVNVVRDALDGGFASSRNLQQHGKRMIDKNYDPGFRIRLHRKDLLLALESAKELDVFLPNTAMSAQLMNAAVGSGLGDLDHSAMKLLLERRSSPDAPEVSPE